jgi:hypothetical protein
VVSLRGTRSRCRPHRERIAGAGEEQNARHSPERLSGGFQGKTRIVRGLYVVAADGFGVDLASQIDRGSFGVAREIDGLVASKGKAFTLIEREHGIRSRTALDPVRKDPMAAARQLKPARSAPDGDQGSLVQADG